MTAVLYPIEMTAKRHFGVNGVAMPSREISHQKLQSKSSHVNVGFLRPLYIESQAVKKIKGIGWYDPNCFDPTQLRRRCRSPSTNDVYSQTARIIAENVNQRRNKRLPIGNRHDPTY